MQSLVIKVKTMQNTSTADPENHTNVLLLHTVCLKMGVKCILNSQYEKHAQNQSVRGFCASFSWQLCSVKKKRICQSFIDEIFRLQIGIPGCFFSRLNVSLKISTKQGVHPPQHSTYCTIHMSAVEKCWHILNTL